MSKKTSVTESKNKNLSVFLKVSKKVADAAIVLSFDCGGNWYALQKLTSGVPCEQLCDGAQDTALVYSVFKCIETKLMGDPTAIMKFRVSSLGCGIQGKTFIIRWNTQGSLSNVRRSLIEAVKCLSPAKAYSKYDKYIRILGGAPKKGVFNGLANNLIKNLKKSLEVSIVGKITTTDEKIKEMTEKIQIKFPDQAQLKPVMSPEKSEIKLGSDYPLVKCSGIDAFMVSSYISVKLGVKTDIVGDGVLVYMNPAMWPTKLKWLKDKKRTDDYSSKSWGKTKGFLAEVFAYYAAVSGMASAKTVKQAAKSKMTVAAISQKIMKCL